MKPILLCLVLAPLAGALVSVDSGLAPLKASSEGRRKGMAWNAAADETLIAWSRAGRTRVRRLAADGFLLAEPIELSGSLNQIDPQVAWSPTAGKYLVVYEEDGAPHVVRGQRLAADGTPVGPSVVIATAAKHSLRPHVTWGSGRWFVVWVEASVESGVTAGATLRGRFVAVDGTPDVQVQIGTVTSFSPRVAFNPATGRHLVVALTTGSASAWSVEDATGTVTPAFTMPASGLAFYPDVAADPTPGSPRFLATWTEFDMGQDVDENGSSDIVFRVQGRFVDATSGEAGAAVTLVETINCVGADPLMEIQNSLAWSQGGFALFGQYLPLGTEGPAELRLFRFDADGVALGGPETISPTVGCIPEPSLAGGGPGRFLCCFRTAGGKELGAQAWAKTLPTPSPSPSPAPVVPVAEGGGGGGGCAARGGVGIGLATMFLVVILSSKGLEAR